MSGRLQVGDSFLLMAALAGLLDESGVAPLFFAAAALHEGGHALAVRACGGTITLFRLTPFALERPHRQQVEASENAVTVSICQGPALTSHLAKIPHDAAQGRLCTAAAPHACAGR